MVNQLDSITNTLPDPDAVVQPVYDAAGNLQILPDATDPSHAKRFTYDFRNRLIKVEESDDYDADVAIYFYDGFNRRVFKYCLTTGENVIYLLLSA